MKVIISLTKGVFLISNKTNDPLLWYIIVDIHMSNNDLNYKGDRFERPY